MTPSDFRRIAISLEGAEESSHMGSPDFRVGGRIFATLASQKQGYGNLMLTPEQQAEFVEEQPDVFVPIDTNNIQHNVTELYLETTFNSFVYNYYIHNLPQLDQYKSAVDFAQRFPDINNVWNQLVNYAKRDTIYLQNIPKDDQEGIKERLKAYLARYKWRTEGFYEILNMKDATIKKALDVLKD